MSFRRRSAILSAASVEVLCPYCGGAQPNPSNGAFLWDPDEVKAESERQADRNCVECDAPLRLHTRSTAKVLS